MRRVVQRDAGAGHEQRTERGLRTLTLEGRECGVTRATEYGGTGSAQKAGDEAGGVREDSEGNERHR